jgi:LysM repeat protein
MKFTFLLVFSLSALTVFSQVKKNATYQDYIEKYKDIAVEQMRTYKIPASITLAQGILESGAGRSALALRSNNHFGIKCGSSWKGKTTKHDDDKRNECFRVYSSPEESYVDHSKFLLKARYTPLFQLNPLDYKGWARGLKACGYATSPVYAKKLIELIDTYELYLYDEDEYGVSRRPVKYDEIMINIHKFFTNNDILCVKAIAGDTWESLSKELGVSSKKLLKFNEAESSVRINEGDLIYIQKKQKKADKKYKKNPWHKVKTGESMYSVAQLYGIRMKNLYKMNFKSPDYTPREGDLLKIR